MAIPLVGKCFATAAEFLAYLERLQFSAWRPRFVTMHHTGSPDLATWRGWQTRAKPVSDANNPGGDEARNWNDEVDILQEFLKAWGPPGLIAVILWVFFFKSERREEKKDARIQMLENQLRESCDERIEAAARLPQTGYRGECGRGDRAEDRRTFRAERSGMTSSRPR